MPARPPECTSLQERCSRAPARQQSSGATPVHPVGFAPTVREYSDGLAKVSVSLPGEQGGEAPEPRPRLRIQPHGLLMLATPPGAQEMKARLRGWTIIAKRHVWACQCLQSPTPALLDVG